MSNLNISPVNPTKAFELAKKLVNLRKIPFFLHGKPGIGKSDIVTQIAADMGMALEILMLTQIDAQDLRGIQYPEPNSKRMVYYPPEFLPGPTSPPTLLFLDELTGAEPRLQVAAYQLLLSRRIGNYYLPDNCYVCAAGNGPTDGAVAYEMGTALASRLLHISVITEPKSWLTWAMQNGIHNSVLTLIQLKGDLLEQTEDQLLRDDLIGPNPRAWARVSDILHGIGLDDRSAVEPLVEGLVGKAAAADLFLTVEELKDLPDIAMLMSIDIKDFTPFVPKTIPGMYGLTYSLVAHASDVQDMTKSIELLAAMVDRATQLPAADAMALGMELLMSKAIKLGVDGEVSSSKAFTVSYSKVLANIDAVAVNKPKRKT